MRTFYKYSYIPFGTKIFFKGDDVSPAGTGTISGETDFGQYIILMENGQCFLVHPKRFEEFEAYFQLASEREEKLCLLSSN